MAKEIKLRSNADRTYIVPDIGDIRPKPVYSLVKRILDLVFAIIGIILALIPIIIIAFCIKIDSTGPIIYTQERLGLNGKPFMILKFRTMSLDAEKDGAQWASKDDERATRIGRFLRKSRMDEIPQLYNIALGQMSFVGPRPERPCFYDEFETYIKGFSQRLKVVPGLTGWAQVNGGYDLAPEEKVIYDMEYIQKRSLRMDLKCLLMTFSVIFTGSGAR